MVVDDDQFDVAAEPADAATTESIASPRKWPWSNSGTTTDTAGRRRGPGRRGLAGVRLAAEEFLHLLAHARHAGHAADQHDVGDVLGVEPGVLQRLLARLDRPLDQVIDQLLEVGAA